MAGATQTIAPEQAVAQLQQSDQAATSRVAAGLGLDQLPQNALPSTPTVEALQGVLGRVDRQGLGTSPAVLQVRFTQLRLGASDAAFQEFSSLVPQELEQVSDSDSIDRYLHRAFSTQQLLKRSSDQRYALLQGAVNGNSRLERPGRWISDQTVDAEGADGFLDLTLVGADAPVEARRIPINRGRFSDLLKVLYRQLSRQEPLVEDDPASPSRQLHALLVAPLLESLQSQDVETLLIAADQGLQAVPFAALSDGQAFFGDRYAFGLTPSLALTPLSPAPARPQGQLLALGASRFDGLAPLPLVPQELEQIDATTQADLHLNGEFSPDTLLKGAADPRYSRVHIATHADFSPGGPARSVLHTGTGPMSMAKFAELRRQRSDVPLDLVVLSACRTLIGDKDSELGFAGLALQAGARSAIGTLWYVDDVVASAFFVQFYRFLDQGVPKAEALMRTRQVFSSGGIRLVGDQVLGDGGDPLLNALSPAQRRRIKAGVQNPFFWAGMELVGSPW